MEIPITWAPKQLTCLSTADVPEDLLIEVCRWLRPSAVSAESKLLFLHLVEATPTARLSSAVVKVAAILTLRAITCTLPDSLHPAELMMLYEMETAGIPDRYLSAVHSVLAIKERWAMNANLSGFFAKARVSNAQD